MHNHHHAHPALMKKQVHSNFNTTLTLEKRHERERGGNEGVRERGNEGVRERGNEGVRE